MLKLEYIKDVTDNNFIGINIYTDLVYPYLQKMKNILGDEYDEYIKYQQDRDRGHYHCTVLNVADLNSITTKDLSSVNSIEQDLNTVDITDFKLLGLGSVERNGNKAYFIVCKSDKLKQFRKKYGKEEIDFHITLGFKHKDVFGLRKNEILPDVKPFIETLKKYYLDLDESFNFLKELENYDYDLSKDIYCIKILDSYAEFRVGNDEGISDYFTISIIGNKLTIACKWQNNKEIPCVSTRHYYLSNTLILRKLNK